MGIAKVCPSSYSQQQLGDLLSQKFIVGLQVNTTDQPWADPLFEHSYTFGLHNILQQPDSRVHEAQCEIQLCACFKYAY